MSGPLTIWRKVSLFETSFVTANPADKNTSAAALAEETLMTAQEFAGANPDAVKASAGDGAHGPDGGVPVWRLFLYPVALAVQLTVSMFAAVTLISGGPSATPRRLVPLLPGMVALVFVTTYVQVAACCTGGPRWALDIWLFSLAYDPLSTMIDWQQLYFRIEGALPIIQAALALLGTVLLAGYRAKNS